MSSRRYDQEIYSRLGHTRISTSSGTLYPKLSLCRIDWSGMHCILVGIGIEWDEVKRRKFVKLTRLQA